MLKCVMLKRKRGKVYKNHTDRGTGGGSRQGAALSQMTFGSRQGAAAKSDEIRLHVLKLVIAEGSKWKAESH